MLRLGQPGLAQIVEVALLERLLQRNSSLGRDAVSRIVLQVSGHDRAGLVDPAQPNQARRLYETAAGEAGHQLPSGQGILVSSAEVVGPRQVHAVPLRPLGIAAD